MKKRSQTDRVDIKDEGLLRPFTQPEPLGMHCGRVCSNDAKLGGGGLGRGWPDADGRSMVATTSRGVYIGAQRLPSVGQVFMLRHLPLQAPELQSAIVRDLPLSAHPKAFQVHFPNRLMCSSGTAATNGAAERGLCSSPSTTKATRPIRESKNGPKETTETECASATISARERMS